MASGYQDSNYTDNLDHLIGAVEGLDDPSTFAQWDNSLFATSIASDRLPTYAPCIPTMRSLKKCLRTSSAGMQSCIPLLHDLEKCSVSYYRDITRSLPKGSCEDEFAAYFSEEVTNAATLKQAKKNWIALHNCAKKVEAHIIEATVPKTQTL